MSRAILTLFKFLVSPLQWRSAFCWWTRHGFQDDPVKNREPWLPSAVVEHLGKLLGKNLNIFEYGSGGSTLFWPRFARRCISIEHDLRWFLLIRFRLGFCRGMDYRLILPEEVQHFGEKDISDPHDYFSSDPDFQGYDFRNYVSQIDVFPDRYFDLVLVDGRVRPSCIMHAVPKVKVGGLLILDDAERPYYLFKTRSYLKDFTCLEFQEGNPTGPGMRKTAIYTREK